MSPFELMADCHQRSAEHCERLSALGAHIHARGIDGQARQTAFQLLRHFDMGLARHHQDEELDLFPALMDAMAGSDPVCIREMTEGLTRDHRALEADWSRIRRELRKVAAGGRAALDPGMVERFCGLMASHRRLEDEELLPMAERLLGAAELQLMGRAMQARREEHPEGKR